MRDSTDITYRGNRRLSGNWGRVFISGLFLFEIKAFEATITADREDVIIGQSKDSKIVSLTGEGHFTIVKVYDMGYKQLLEDWKAGHDSRFVIVASIADPDAIGGQQIRVQIENVWINELPVINFEKGAVIEDEIQFGFTSEDCQYLETIEL